MTSFAAGQCWTYNAPADAPQSRLVIGAILDFDGGRRIACCAVTGTQVRPDAVAEPVRVPFLPMTIEALAATVVELDGTSDLPNDFATALEAWQHDPRGLSYFTVPFEGSLERMIAMQMAAIVGQS